MSHENETTISSISSAKMELSADVYLIHEWSDRRCRWQPLHGNDQSLLTFFINIPFHSFLCILYRSWIFHQDNRDKLRLILNILNVLNYILDKNYHPIQFIVMCTKRVLEHTYDRNVSTWPLIFWQRRLFVSFLCIELWLDPNTDFCFHLFFVKILIPSALDT